MKNIITIPHDFVFDIIHLPNNFNISDMVLFMKSFLEKGDVLIYPKKIEEQVPKVDFVTFNYYDNTPIIELLYTVFNNIKENSTMYFMGFNGNFDNKFLKDNYRYLYNINYIEDWKKYLKPIPISVCDINFGFVSKYINQLQHPEFKYLQLLRKILLKGEIREYERTGNGTVSLFNEKLEIDLSDGYFPVQDCRKTPYKTIWREVCWYLSGSTDVKELHKYNIKIWDGNTSREYLDNNGHSMLDGDNYLDEHDIGPTYGYQFRHSGYPYEGKDGYYYKKGVDQWQKLIDEIRNNPQSRRLIIDLYDVSQIEKMAIPPCVCFYQFYVHNDGKIDVQMKSRSSDIFLAGYWNLCQGAIILHLLCKELEKEYKPGKLIFIMGDVHIYKFQIDKVKELLKLKPQKYYKLEKIDQEKGPILNMEYNPQSLVSSKMAI